MRCVRTLFGDVWGKIQRVNTVLDSQYLLKYSRPPIVFPKLDDSDAARMQEFKRHGKERFEVEEAALPQQMSDPSTEFLRSFEHEEGYDHKIALQNYVPSAFTKGGKSLTRLTCLVIIGNGRGAGGFGYARHSNYLEKGPVLQEAIKNAFKNLVIIDNNPATVVHPIKTRFRTQHIELLPHNKIVATTSIFSALKLIGLKKVKVRLLPSARKTPLFLKIQTIFYALDRFYRSPRELAAERGLVPQGFQQGAKRYVDEVRAFKGMYSVAPPVNNRTSVADRWKWNLNRQIVMPYPNKTLMQEILYRDVGLASDLAKEKHGKNVTVDSLNNRSEATQKNVANVNSGRSVSSYWEDKEEYFREETAKFASRKTFQK